MGVRRTLGEEGCAIISGHKSDEVQVETGYSMMTRLHGVNGANLSSLSLWSMHALHSVRRRRPYMST